MSESFSKQPSNHMPSKFAWLDRAAIALSGLCVVHCIASILLVIGFASVATSLVDERFLDERFHEFGLLLAVILSSIAFASGWLRHRNTQPLVIGGAGIGLMALALLLGHGIHEIPLTIVGVILVALGHQRNLRLAPRAA
jgi:hypothetical protein